MKYRKIYPTLWNDAKFRTFSDNAKLLWFMILTHPHTTPLGTIREFKASLARELGWATKKFNTAFKTLEDAGFVVDDDKAGIIWIRNFFRYNQPENINVLRSWEAGLEDCPEGKMMADIYLAVRSYVKELSNEFRVTFTRTFYADFGRVIRQIIGDDMPEDFELEILNQKKPPKAPTPPVTGAGAVTGTKTGTEKEAGTRDRKEHLVTIQRTPFIEPFRDEFKREKTQDELDEEEFEKLQTQKPSLEGIKRVCELKNLSVNPQKIFDYYESHHWEHEDGVPVREWWNLAFEWEYGDVPDDLDDDTVYRRPSNPEGESADVPF